MNEASAKTILVVDDEPLVLRIARHVLEAKGFNVLEAADGQAALDVCLKGSESIDLLLTDIKMPRLNGVELALRIAEQKPEVPVLFMSGYTADSVVRELLRSRPRVAELAVLAKPFRPAELIQAVEALLRRSEAVRVLDTVG